MQLTGGEGLALVAVSVLIPRPVGLLTHQPHLQTEWWTDGGLDQADPDRLAQAGLVWLDIQVQFEPGSFHLPAQASKESAAATTTTLGLQGERRTSDLRPLAHRSVLHETPHIGGGPCDRSTRSRH